MLWVTMHDGRRRALPEAQELEVEALAGQRIERAERLVEQEHLGLERERPGEARRAGCVPPDSSDGREPRDGRVEADELGRARETRGSPLGAASRRARAGR